MQGRGAGRDGPGALPPRPLHDGGRPMRTGVRHSSSWVNPRPHGLSLVLNGQSPFSRTTLPSSWGPSRRRRWPRRRHRHDDAEGLTPRLHEIAG